jgi:Fe-S-cluster-containing dehydrogenase component
MTRLALLADLDRCTGCQTCVVACKAEKHLAAGMRFIRLVQVGPTGEFPDLSMYYLPLACQQCSRPGCAAACPENAIAKASDGTVLVDSASCTGCGDCVDGCPYGAILLDPGARLARKCDLCGERLALGIQPACVAVCPGKALEVIDIDAGVVAGPVDHSEGAVPLTLKASAGTEPNGRFVLTRQPWRDVC